MKSKRNFLFANQSRKPVYQLGASQRLYSIWKGMHHRCYREQADSYIHYGARGIEVCKKWHWENPSGFLNFYLDMGNPPEGHSLDRINVNGNYEPKNCQWSNQSQQSKGRRKFGSLAKYSTKEVADYVAKMPIKDIVVVFTAVLRKRK